MNALETYKQALNKEINETSGVLKSKEKSLEDTQKRIKRLEETKDTNLRKKLILQEACKKARELSSDLFAMISTNGVKTILGDNLEVKIISGEKNGVPTSDFIIHATYDGYSTDTDPAEEDGGGVADIVSLTNFLSMNIINSKINSAVIIVDEPTKFVSMGNANSVGNFLKSISQEFNKQIIMVTHAKETTEYAQKVFSVSLDSKGTSIVTELEVSAKE